ncbi:AbrB/MazE/SpoVT family DNA-binding domain-containing protein [Candidatus Woesearchaeota archaeon]|nr:AbrB/MazE/SpoVT family DNA-binding domain-containing protein [Candidatus Woesearchaeota archaeon]
MHEPKFIGKVRLTGQGQLTLPTEARKDLDISLGSELYWYEFNGSLIVSTKLVNQKELRENIQKKR